MTVEQYVAAVEAALGDVPPRERDEALRELESLLREDAARRGETAAVASLGDARAYAEQVREALQHGSTDPAEPQGHVLGMPYEFRLGDADRIGSRIWNPSDPRIFTPRLFGVGWTINFGALAVKLHLVRPDDFTDEAMAHIPLWAANVALAIPVAFASATTLLLALTWRRLPAELPMHWSGAGTPDDWAPKGFAVGLLIALGVVPVALSVLRLVTRRAPVRDRVLVAAGVTVVASIGLGIATITVSDAGGGSSGGWLWLVIVGGLVLSFLQLYVPSRLGLRAEWRAAAAHKKGEPS